MPRGSVHIEKRSCVAAKFVPGGAAELPFSFRGPALASPFTRLARSQARGKFGSFTSQSVPPRFLSHSRGMDEVCIDAFVVG